MPLVRSSCSRETDQAVGDELYYGQLLHAQGLVDDIGALRPTIFIGVPRVFDRIYSGVLSKIQVEHLREAHACPSSMPASKGSNLCMTQVRPCQAAVAPANDPGDAVVQEAGGLKAFLFNWGFKRKLHFIEQGHPQHTVSLCWLMRSCFRACYLSAHARLLCACRQDSVKICVP